MAAMETPPLPPYDELSSSVEHFQYKAGRDSATDVRNVLLVVAALIAAATFAAAVNPPGGVWQESKVVVLNAKEVKQIAGKSVHATNTPVSFTVFLFSNSAAFSASTLVISYLVYGFPFYYEICFALLSMLFTYGASLGAISSGTGVNSSYIYVALLLPYIVRYLALMYKKCSKQP